MFKNSGANCASSFTNIHGRANAAPYRIHYIFDEALSGHLRRKTCGALRRAQSRFSFVWKEGGKGTGAEDESHFLTQAGSFDGRQAFSSCDFVNEGKENGDWFVHLIHSALLNAVDDASSDFGNQMFGIAVLSQFITHCLKAGLCEASI